MESELKEQNCCMQSMLYSYQLEINCYNMFYGKIFSRSTKQKQKGFQAYLLREAIKPQRIQQEEEVQYLQNDQEIINKMALVNLTYY
jgi:hypothetical protein